MKTHKLNAEQREITGRKVKTLRDEGLVPANVFGKDVKSQAVQVKVDDFKKIYEEAGETGVLELTVGKGKAVPVLIANVQQHPVTDSLLHVDFRQIDLTQKVTATVPVELVGESPAEKSGIGTVVQQVSELEVEALPTDLPESFEVDISTLEEVDAAIYVKDLKYDKAKVTVEAEQDQIVAKVEPPQKEEVIAPPVEEEVAAEEGAEAPEAGEPKEETATEEVKEKE